MSLKQYQAKRKFGITQEPKGGPSAKNPKGKLHFVVQKHAARRLHYDLRLEVGGVLASWAVPKGPSLDPADKRLAIHVEDHPLEYGSFEGTIPAGQYGAGQVIVWDEGYYVVPGETKKEQEKFVEHGLKKGELTFTLHGKKLQGDFVLVKLARDPEGKQWLLIKRKDAFQSKEDVTKKTRSVLSKKDIPEDAKLGTKSSMPHDIKPMLCFLVDEPFDGADWIFENKWDGYRAIAEITPKKVHLYSRNQLSFNQQFPSIVASLKRIKDEMILDGEIVILDSKGHSRFQWLQNYLNSHEGEGTLKYCVFDILYYKGRDLRQVPLLERKEILAKVVKGLGASALMYSDHVAGEGKAFFKAIQKNDLEGMIAKEVKSPYVSTRSRSWLKIKTHLRQEVVIAGFTEPKGSRKKMGALIIGIYEKGKLVYAGHVGGGFSQKSLGEVHEQLTPLINRRCPFNSVPKTNAPVTWVKPQLICEVSFQEWTQEGIMRQPIFQGLRGDKSPKSVTSEKVESTQKALKKTTKTKKKTESSAESLDTIITHSEKVLFPDEGYTKEDLLKYYQSISSYILPHLKDRPITLHRYPDGIHGKSFFQKEAPDFIPDWIQTAKVKQSDKAVNYLLIPDEPSLLYAVNLASIELHPFLSTYPEVDYPDFLVLDIDPGELPFSAVIEVAQEVHKILKKLGVEGYCKTSGKRGVHIYLPLQARYEYEVVENLAKLLALYIHQTLPSLTSVVRDPSQRKDKVYIDYLQNGRSKTVVAPYSVRPVEGASVSAPLEWKEVKKGLDPHDFTIKTMPGRLAKKGDLFKPVLGKGISIKSLLAKLQ